MRFALLAFALFAGLMADGDEGTYVKLLVSCDHHNNMIDLQFELEAVGHWPSKLAFQIGQNKGINHPDGILDGSVDFQTEISFDPAETYTVSNPKQGRYCNGVTGNPNLYLKNLGGQCECTSGNCGSPSENKRPGHFLLGRCGVAQTDLPSTNHSADGVSLEEKNCVGYEPSESRRESPNAPFEVTCTYQSEWAQEYEVYCLNHQDHFVYLLPGVDLNPVVDILIDGGGSHDAEDSDWIVATATSDSLVCFDKRGSIPAGVTGNPDMRLWWEDGTDVWPVWEGRCNEHRPPGHYHMKGTCGSPYL